MQKEHSRKQLIQRLQEERDELQGEVNRACVMDDEGMGGEEKIIYVMEKRLAQIDLELKKLSTKST